MSRAEILGLVTRTPAPPAPAGARAARWASVGLLALEAASLVAIAVLVGIAVLR